MPTIPTKISQLTGRATVTRGPALAREQFKDRAQNATQANTQRAIQQAAASPFANGVLLTGVQFTTATVAQLAHKLGRQWVGYFLVNASASSVVGTPNVLAQSGYPPGILALYALGTFTADVWVY